MAQPRPNTTTKMSVTKMERWSRLARSKSRRLARQSPTKVLESHHASLGLVQAPLPGAIFGLQARRRGRGTWTGLPDAAADQSPKAKAVTRALASRFPALAEFLQLHLQLQGCPELLSTGGGGCYLTMNSVSMPDCQLIWLISGCPGLWQWKPTSPGPWRHVECIRRFAG